MVGWGGGVGGFRRITEFKPKPDLASVGIWLGWGCDNLAQNIQMYQFDKIVPWIRMTKSNPKRRHLGL